MINIFDLVYARLWKRFVFAQIPKEIRARDDFQAYMLEAERIEGVEYWTLFRNGDKIIQEFGGDA